MAIYHMHTCTMDTGMYAGGGGGGVVALYRHINITSILRASCLTLETNEYFHFPLFSPHNIQSHLLNITSSQIRLKLTFLLRKRATVIFATSKSSTLSGKKARSLYDTMFGSWTFHSSWQ